MMIEAQVHAEMILYFQYGRCPSWMNPYDLESHNIESGMLYEDQCPLAEALEKLQ